MRANDPSLHCWSRHLPIVMAAAISTLPCLLGAQTTGVVQGAVTRADQGTPIVSVSVTVQGTPLTAVTDRNGQYVLSTVPTGSQTIVFRWLGFRPREITLTVTAGQTHTVNAALETQPVLLGEITVTGPSRGPERIVESPAAVSVVEPAAARDLSITGQAPRAVADLTGIDVVQSGINDFNVNSRGFNSALNQRVLVLQDGRNLAFAFLGSQEWSAMSLPLEDMGQIEIVRGPASALYGANAYAGVLNIRTPTAREVVGTKLTVAGGELSTIRGDLRHAGVFGNRRFGYRLNLGYYRSDTWSRSRTNLGDLAREYGAHVDTTDFPVNPPSPGFEVVPLSGQTKQGPPRTPGAVTGDRDDIVNMYGSGRFDYYADNGSVFTAEGGAARVENDVFMTPIGRVQIAKALRPWGRIALAAPDIYVSAWYTGRNTLDPQIALSSGLPIEEVSHIIQGESQYSRLLLNGRAQVVLGGSIRTTFVDTKGTLVQPENDNRHDESYAAYGQIDFEVIPQLRVVGALRYDQGDLFDAQFSPKAALVYSPNEQHAFRFTVNRAFQTGNTLQYFLGTPAGAPADFSALEAGLRASPLGPVLAGVPVGELFTNSSAVPILGLGNENIDVEVGTSLEVGYKGQITERLFLTIDAYYSKLSDFVTSLLPGVNPTYAPWTAPDAVPETLRETVEQTVRDQLLAAGQPLAAAGLTRLQDGSSAIVVSIGNAGKVDEYGVEVSAGIRVTDEIKLNANYSLFEFDIDSTSLVAGDRVLPNTPQHKANVTAMYAGAQGLDARLSVRLVDSYEWAGGIFFGGVPSGQTVDLSAGYQINSYVRLHAVATNVFDQRRYQVYGGSLMGRRVLAGLTATF